MAGEARAGLLISGVWREASGIAGRSHPHARNLPEKALCTPEAAESEHRGFEPFRIRPLQRTVEDMMRGGGGNGPLASGQRFFRRGQVQFLVQQIAEEEHHDSFPAAAPSGDGDAGSLTLALVAYKVKEQRDRKSTRLNSSHVKIS